VTEEKEVKLKLVRIEQDKSAKIFVYREIKEKK